MAEEINLAYDSQKHANWFVASLSFQFIRLWFILLLCASIFNLQVLTAVSVCYLWIPYSSQIIVTEDLKSTRFDAM